MNFASDNWAGATGPIMNAIVEANSGYACAYGGDDLTLRVQELFSDVFERKVFVYFVATGTAANSMCLAHVARPGGIVLCHKDSHIAVDECGAPEFYTRGKLIQVNGTGAKITPDTLSHAMSLVPVDVVHHGQLDTLTLTQATECGTVYDLAEIQALVDLGKTRDLTIHMDGARFANAMVSLDTTPAEMTWKSGVDMVSFGATKNGALCAEAVVIFDETRARGFEYSRKRGGHLFSKSRFVAAQFEAYFNDDHWIDTAKYANGAATKLSKGLSDTGSCRIAWPTQANEVFAYIDKSLDTILKQEGAMYHAWPAASLIREEQPGKDETLIRLVTSFQTQQEDITRFISLLK